MVKKPTLSVDIEQLKKSVKDLLSPLQLSKLGDSFPQEREPKKWLTGKDLTTLWGIREFELLAFMKKGLQAYTPHGKKIVDSDSLEHGRPLTFEQVKANFEAKQQARCLGSPGTSMGPPKTEAEINYLAKKYYESQSLKIINPPKDCEIMSFHIPMDESKANEMISRSTAFLFRIDDVLKFELEHEKVPQEPQAQSTPPAIRSSQEDPQWAIELTESPSPLPQDQVKPENYFVRKKKVWEIGFGDEEGSFPDYAYIRCVVMLLSKPGEAISCIELSQAMTGKFSGKEIMTDDQVMAEGLNPPTKTKVIDAIIDSKGKEKLKIKLKELLGEREKIESEPGSRGADEEMELIEIEKEIEEITKQLSRSNRFNTFESPDKKAQSNIKKHLKTAYTTLQKANMKHLSKHLDKKIKPAGGYNYRYIDTETHWEISW